MSRDKLKEGDIVIVHKPINDESWVRGMDKFDGIKTTISKVAGTTKHLNPETQLVNLDETRKHYHLDGCVSAYGIPYSFCLDWLERA